MNTLPHRPDVSHCNLPHAGRARRHALTLVGAAAILLAACKTDSESPAATTAASAPAASSAVASSSAAASSGPAASGSTVEPAPPKADPSRLELEGKAIQGGLLQAHVDPATRKLKFPGHKAVISEEGDFLIAFYRNAPQKETLTITFPDGAQLEHHFEIEQRTYEKDVINGLPEKWVKLDTATKKKLHEANGRIELIRNKYTKKPYYKEGFVWPVKGRLTSTYGQPRTLNGVDSGIHWGVDIAAVQGTPVKAPTGGKVVFVEPNVPLSGHVLIIDHGHGLSSTFLHLASFAKKVGDEVAKGDVVATVGMTGRTNGAHLDWRMNYFKIRIDPALLVPPMEGQGSAVDGGASTKPAK